MTTLSELLSMEEEDDTELPGFYNPGTGDPDKAQRLRAYARAYHQRKYRARVYPADFFQDELDFDNRDDE